MTSYKNILLPVTPELDEFIALRKAIELSSENQDTNIHIVRCSFKDAWQNLRKWLNFQKVINKPINRFNRTDINEVLYTEISNQHPSISFYSSNMELKRNNKELLAYIGKHNIDLVIVCERNIPSPIFSLKRINTDKIARLSSCSILNITPRSLQHTVRSILLPVGLSIHEKNIQIAISFAKTNKGLIHLITFLDKMNSDDSKKKIEVFYKTYKLLKECGYTPQYKIIERVESTEALLEYAQRINADLLLLTPNRKSILSGIIKQSILKRIYPYSTLHVLTSKSSIPN